MKKSSASEIVGVLAIQVMDAFWQVAGAGPLVFKSNDCLKGDFPKWDFTCHPARNEVFSQKTQETQSFQTKRLEVQNEVLFFGP